MRHAPITAMLSTAALMLTLVATATTPAASATVADSVRADLEHATSGVAVSGVSVRAPTVEEAQTGATTVLDVAMILPPGRPLSGLIALDGGSPVTTTSALIARWDLAVVEAAKHANRSGAAIDAVSITRSIAGQAPAAASDFVMRLGTDETPASPTVQMTLDEVRTAVRGVLPAWASQATVDATDDAAGERAVLINLKLPSAAFRLVNVVQALDTVALAQQALWDQGARIGRVIVTVEDPGTGDPLYIGGADAFYGHVVQWFSPLVQGFLGPLTPATPLDEAPIPELPA